MALRAEERRDKLRKAAVRSKYPMTRRYLNGETRLSKPQSPYTEYIGIRREPAELKHLSRRRKRKKFDSVSSGERTRKSPNRCACTTGYGLRYGSVEDSRRVWEVPPERVKASYMKSETRLAGSGVPRDTRNLVGRRRDHPPRLNTTQ